jgi:FlaA1/EpsC-like NDP-sugar epimerase
MSGGSRHRTFVKANRLCDLGLVSVIFLAALAISSSSFTWPSLAEVLVIRIKVANLLLFAGYLGLCWVVLSACGLYRSHRLSRWPRRLYEMCLAVTVLTGALFLLRRPLDLAFATDTFLLLFWLLTLLVLTLSREISLQVLHLARRRGRNLRHIIIIGEGRDAAALATRIGQETSLGYRVLRVIDAEGMSENGRNVADF